MKRISCTHCGSSEYQKNGSSQGIQRYICKHCARCFSNNVPKFGREVREKALQMYLNNVGIRKIALFLGASPAGVLKWIRKAGQELSGRLHQAASQVEQQLPDVIEMDEIYTYIQKNGNGQSSGLLILDNKVALLRLK
jgi:transposase-like protein